MSVQINDKLTNKNKSIFLKNAVKAIHSKQEKTIQKANKIIGDVENFEKEVDKRFTSYS